ncbi:unnamed protein product [Chrysoparadoxa australica]
MPPPIPGQARRNLLIGSGVVACACFMGAIPYMVSRSAPRNLSHTEAGLTGSQVQRGVYLNTGSKDVGIDPDWDMKAGTWRGQPRQTPKKGGQAKDKCCD